MNQTGTDDRGGNISTGDYDVVVCGGGPAGCSAAIAAARLGARTLLVEKYGFPGGAAVAQLVGVVLSTNRVDFQGVWHEWARRLMKSGGMAPLHFSPHKLYPGTGWWRSSLDSEAVKRVWDDLLEEHAVEVLLLAHLHGVVVEDGRVTGALLHTRAGSMAIRAQRVVDATGDAAVCHEAGVPWNRGVVGKLWGQQVSLCYRIGGTGDGRMAPRPDRFGRVDMLEIDPLDPFVVSEAMRRGRREISASVAATGGNAHLVDTAAELGVRISRVVEGIDTVSDDDAWSLRKHADGVARSSWELDVHPPDLERPLPERFLHSQSPAYADFTRRLSGGEWFDVPYGALVPRGVDNLLVAGRCVSAGYVAQGSVRIQQTCMATGEAAGAAAALSLERKTTPRELDPTIVSTHLERVRDVEPAFAES